MRLLLLSLLPIAVKGQSAECLAAMARNDRNDDSRLNMPEYINLVLDFSTFDGCPSLTDLTAFLDGGTFAVTFYNLSCLCLRYSDNQDCCEDGLVYDDTYPATYLERICETISDVTNQECSDEEPIGTTESPTLAPLTEILSTDRPSPAPVMVAISTAPTSAPVDAIQTPIPVEPVLSDPLGNVGGRSSNSDNPNRGLTIAMPVILGVGFLVAIALFARRRQQQESDTKNGEYREFTGSNHSDTNENELPTNEITAMRFGDILDTIEQGDEHGEPSMPTTIDNSASFEVYESQSSTSSVDGIVIARDIPSLQESEEQTSLSNKGTQWISAAVAATTASFPFGSNHGGDDNDGEEEENDDHENRSDSEGAFAVRGGDVMMSPLSVDGADEVHSSSVLVGNIDKEDDILSPVSLEAEPSVHSTSVLVGDITKEPWISSSDTDSSFHESETEIEPLDFGPTLETLPEEEENSMGLQPRTPDSSAQRPEVPPQSKEEKAEAANMIQEMGNLFTP